MPTGSSICWGTGSPYCRDRGTVGPDPEESPRWTRMPCPSMPTPCWPGCATWVECESPTFDAGAVNRMMDIASRDLILAGARIERIAGRMGFGDCVRASFPHATPDVPGILVMGHLDTVHPIGTLANLPFRREGNRAWGPGILDMKGGNYLSLEAIRQLQRAGLRTKLPITVLFTSDEEVGSPSTRDLIEAEAAATNTCWCRSRPGPMAAWSPGAMRSRGSTWRPPGGQAMPGPGLGDGRSAIREMARKLIEIEDMTTDELHLQRRRDPWRTVGQLRHHHLHR